VTGCGTVVLDTLFMPRLIVGWLVIWLDRPLTGRSTALLVVHGD
jgi:hypothetical protein